MMMTALIMTIMMMVTMTKCESNSDSEGDWLGHLFNLFSVSGKFCQKEEGLTQSDINRNTCKTLTACILDYHIDEKNATAELKVNFVTMIMKMII